MTNYNGSSVTWYDGRSSEWSWRYITPTVYKPTVINTNPVTTEITINSGCMLEEKGKGGRKLNEDRALYRIWVVDPKKNGTVIMAGEYVIANDEENALLKSNMSEAVRARWLELEDVDYMAEEVGRFIRPKKVVQQVRSVGKEDE